MAKVFRMFWHLTFARSGGNSGKDEEHDDIQSVKEGAQIKRIVVVMRSVGFDVWRMTLQNYTEHGFQLLFNLSTADISIVGRSSLTKYSVL